MQAIDGMHNGWRHIILPMAHADELVMNAVLAASSFHRHAHLDAATTLPTSTTSSSDSSPTASTVSLANAKFDQIWRTQKYEHIPSPQSLYNTTIRGLQQRSNLTQDDPETSQATLVAVLVLLVAAMVSGRDDYQMILGMLQSAVEVCGGEDRLSASEVGRFLVRQIRK
jgi:hypothetical protein